MPTSRLCSLDDVRCKQGVWQSLRQSSLFHFFVDQGCGNTMPDLSDLVLFHSGQVENFYLLVLGQVQMYKVNTILYFIFWLVITSSHVALKTVWILISWLLQKPANLDLHFLQESWYLISYCFQSVNCLSTERYKLICSFGQVKFSLDKNSMAIYLSLDKQKILLFPHPCRLTQKKTNELEYVTEYNRGFWL